jgi:DNA invertase Pin-like site-specific DNA recombinase
MEDLTVPTVPIAQEKPKFKVFLYARVSTDDKGQDEAAQLEPMRNYCKAMDWENAGEFIDEVSGTDKTRKQLRRMLKKLDKKEAAGLFVWKLDRLNRFKATDAMLLIDELTKRGISLKSLQEPWADTTVTNPTTTLLLFITAWIAEQERANISARVKAGIASRRKAGTWHGGRPKGRKDSTPRKRRWDKKPDVQINELFEEDQKEIPPQEKPPPIDRFTTD